MRNKNAVAVIAFGVVFVAAALGIAWDVSLRAARMGSAVAEDSNFSLQEGAKAKFVVRIDSVSTDLSAHILEAQSQSDFRQTSRVVKIKLLPTTSFVMGDVGDLKPNGIVQVAGLVGADKTIAAERIVILTGYVRALP